MVNKKRVSKVLVFVLLIGTLLSSVAFAADTKDYVIDKDIKISTKAHIQSFGDREFETDDKGVLEFGTTGKAKRLEEFALKLEGAPKDMAIEYRVHGQSYGDMPAEADKWIRGDKEIGSRGKAKRIEGIQIRLVNTETGKAYEGYSVEYQVHMQSFGWGVNKTDKGDVWAKDGEFAGTKGLSKRLEAVRVRIKKEDKLKITGFEAIGAKKLEVKFNKPVKDVNKATITVKKGTILVNTDKIAFAEDKKSAVIETTVPLTKGEYTISVSGLDETVLTAKTSVDDAKVTKINLLSTQAPRLNTNPKQASISYEVLNQYGEKMTGQTVNWTSSTGETFADSSGSLTITAPGGVDFIPGSVVYLTGVHANSGTVVNTQVEIVLAAKANTLEFKGVYDKSKAKLVDLPAGFDNNRYVLLFEVKDQYGNKIDPANVNKNDLVFTSSNPLFISSVLNVSTDVSIDGTKYKAIALIPGSAADKGGTVTIQAISITTGNISKYVVQAEALSEVKSFTMSAPEKIVAEGEKVEIPFVAIDQYGNAVTKYEALNGHVALTPAFDSKTGLKFEKQKDGSAKLFYTAPTKVASDNVDYPAYLTSVVVGGNFSSIMLNVKAMAKPVVVAGVKKDLVTNVAIGGAFNLNRKNIIVKDQYGRDFDLKDKLATTNAEGTYNIKVVAKSGSEYLNDITGVIDANDAEVKVEGKAKGTAVLAITLQEGNGSEYVDIKNSEYTLNVNVASKKDFASYEIAELKAMYDNTNPAYSQDLVVYGVKADGSKVVIPVNEYTVTTNNAALVYNAGKLSSNGSVVGSDGKDVTVKVSVVVDASDSPVVMTKDVVVTKPDLTIAKAEWKDTDSAKIVDGVLEIASANVGTTKNLTDALKLKDQFGGDYKLDEHDHTVTITNIVNAERDEEELEIALTDNGKKTLVIKNAKADDTFNMTIVVDGKSYTIKVKVK